MSDSDAASDRASAPDADCVTGTVAERSVGDAVTVDVAVVRPQPVRPDERVASVDVLRGVALLGILPMNMAAFAWPMAGYENPALSGGADPANAAAWVFNSLVFSGKMMTLFSMLFGAGLVLMADRAAARGASILGTYYRRVLWLLVIGLIHAYLIWTGDILVMYALCGLVLYFFRRWKPRTLIIISIILLAIGAALQMGFVVYSRFVSQVSAQVEADRAAGREVAEWQAALHKSWTEGFRAVVQPTEEEFQRDIDLYRGGYWSIVVGRAPGVLMFQTFGFVLFMFWGASGRMLLGMALMKLGVFSASRSARFYRLLAAFGYGIGLPLTAWGTVLLLVHDYDPLQTPLASLVLGLGMVPVALGHAAMVMLICQAGFVTGLTSRLAAVGRTALSNYLLQSLLCTTLFYGYGFGLFGSVDRVGMWGIVLVIWVLQLAISPLWLRTYRFGPAEWLWRSLTYWRWQPMRNDMVPAPVLR
jgi:uncharacterized protein